MFSLKNYFYFILFFIYIYKCENASVQRATPLRPESDFGQSHGFLQNQEDSENSTPEIKTKKSETISGRTFRTNEDSRSQGRRIDKGHNKTRQKSGFYNSYRR